MLNVMVRLFEYVHQFYFIYNKLQTAIIMRMDALFMMPTYPMENATI